MLAVYVPTNHLYLGDIVICKRDRATFPDISVEEGIRIFLTGGMGLPARVGEGAETTGGGTSGYNPVLCASAVRAGVRFELSVLVLLERPSGLRRTVR